MAQIALDNWIDVEGYAIANGVGRIANLSISEFCSFMWYMIAQGHEDQTSLDKTKAKLWQPPRGYGESKKKSANDPWSKEAQMQGFNNLKAQLGL